MDRLDLCAPAHPSSGPLLRLSVESTFVLTPERIQNALNGDQTALTELVLILLATIKVEVAVHLFRRARAQRRDPRQDVEDFSQEVVLHLLAERGRLLRTWDPARGQSLAGFVRMIARQRVSRILQGHRGNPWSEEPTDSETIEPLLEPAAEDHIFESRESLRTLLEHLRSRLTERGLQLFHRIYIDQLPIQEVAEEFKMTRGALDAWNTRTRNIARAHAADILKKRRP